MSPCDFIVNKDSLDSKSVNLPNMMVHAFNPILGRQKLVSLCEFKGQPGLLGETLSQTKLSVTLTALPVTHQLDQLCLSSTLVLHTRKPR